MENILRSERTHVQATASTQRSFPSIDEEVVGFEDDAVIITELLTGGTKELDIVSIVGMPGLGKTTLARKVFNHFIENKHFDVRAWCSISKEYSSRKVFSEILKQVVGDMDGIGDEGIIRERKMISKILEQAVGNVEDGIKDEDMPDNLRKSLMRKRYLIVLDDIWEVKAWEDLQFCFHRMKMEAE